MNEFDDDKKALTFDEQGKIIKPPRARSIPLKTSLDVRKELARLYNDARSGKVETGDATKLGYLLNLLRTAIETSDIEQRLEQLEQQSQGG